MIARGSFGNPWIFEELTGARDRGARPRTRSPPSCSGSSTAPRSTSASERAARYLRKFYPWYLARLGIAARGGRVPAARRPSLRTRVRELIGSRRPARRAIRTPRLRAGREPVAIVPRRRARRCAPQQGFAIGHFWSLGARFSAPATITRKVRDVARESLITPEGLEKLKAELEELQTVRRREVAERIKEAREFGDIAENSEYDDAKNEQAMLEQRIAQMEERVRRATVIDEKQLDTGIVSVGVKVHVKDQKTGDSRKFQLVGSAEANPAEDKLSHESPIGKALMGRKRGEVVSVEVPRGPASASSRSPRSKRPGRGLRRAALGVGRQGCERPGMRRFACRLTGGIRGTSSRTGAGSARLRRSEGQADDARGSGRASRRSGAGCRTS